MATNMTHKYTKTEVWPVPTQTPSGAAVLSSTFQPGVTITGSGDYVKSEVTGPYTTSGIPAGGIGLKALEATVAVDGAFRFPVVGAVASTPKNTAVYAVLSGATVTGLTLTVGTNKLFGKFDRLIGEAGATETSVWIGA